MTDQTSIYLLQFKLINVFFRFCLRSHFNPVIDSYLLYLEAKDYGQFNIRFIERIYGLMKYLMRIFLIVASCHAVSKKAEQTAILMHRIQNRRDKCIKEIVSMTFYLNCNSW